MKTVDKMLLNQLSQQAKKSPRKRAHHLFHSFSDPVQRMVNAMEPGSYIPPHKHQNPKKIEAFIVLKGKAACLKFNNKGKVIKVHIINEKGPKYAVDISPGTWHTFVSMKKNTALFEVIQGPYDKKTHKNKAPWAPTEEKGSSYLKKLEQIIRKWEKK